MAADRGRCGPWTGGAAMSGCPWYVPDRLCELAVEEGKKEASSIVVHVLLGLAVLWLVME